MNSATKKKTLMLVFLSMLAFSTTVNAKASVGKPVHLEKPKAGIYLDKPKANVRCFWRMIRVPKGFPAPKPPSEWICEKYESVLSPEK